MMRQLILTFLLIHGLCFSADESYWDTHLVREYVHNSELQRRWAMAFLAPHLKQLNGNEKILDIGCGDGKITADVSRFIPQGSILGIDPSHAMLEWAKKQFSSHDYPNLAFLEGGFLTPNISENYDLIYSTCALQHCLSPLEAFENLEKLLKPGGKLLIMIPSMHNEAWKIARKKVHASEKWTYYLKNIAPRQFLEPEEYIQLLTHANFKPLKLKRIASDDPFVDRKELLMFLLGTFSPAVPQEMRMEFYNDLIDAYLEALPEALNSNGVLEARFGRIEIEATK